MLDAAIKLQLRGALEAAFLFILVCSIISTLKKYFYQKHAANRHQQSVITANKVSTTGPT